ncbi:hypothetical protein SPRG_13064 [Saprolegnia parasitica CBS 223.65]|uniref:Uncharacterized protein n=1 Tax=Saprolegnia parasitica (strain CBS 223.65) TaxID=695850 RepID=A0A067BN73_SAPPC|nr:hypothetical protein SPRG_13064 [Saprolegnia parasitica CBS 223.65]KDO19959.1 hypothetical protein SPRG_13064 [Saprolegnia parasitica CBS 223.65]|eukprot:XP_012209329.1 hypothetical protein SPRG_13064 [Saprolegnia parasitica CBS 223.65]
MKSLLTRARLPPIAEVVDEADADVASCRRPADYNDIFAKRPVLLRSRSGDSYGMQTMHFISMVFSVVCIEICKGVLLRLLALVTLFLMLLVCHQWYLVARWESI